MFNKNPFWKNYCKIFYLRGKTTIGHRLQGNSKLQGNIETFIWCFLLCDLKNMLIFKL